MQPVGVILLSSRHRMLVVVPSGCCSFRRSWLLAALVFLLLLSDSFGTVVSGPWSVPGRAGVYAVVAGCLLPSDPVSVSIFFSLQDPCSLRHLGVGRHFDTIRALHVAVD